MEHIPSLGVRTMIPFSKICSIGFQSHQESNEEEGCEGMDRYERITATKRRRVDTIKRMSTAQTLLQQFEDRNGFRFCEPHTGTSTATSLFMCDIESLEHGYQYLPDENGKLSRECERLKEENQRLMKENSTLKGQYKHVQEECRKLKETKAVNE